MDDSRLYRAQARSFERQAELARRTEARKELLELAKLWGQLADKAERAERLADHRRQMAAGDLEQE